MASFICERARLNPWEHASVDFVDVRPRKSFFARSTPCHEDLHAWLVFVCVCVVRDEFRVAEFL